MQPLKIAYTLTQRRITVFVGDLAATAECLGTYFYTVLMAEQTLVGISNFTLRVWDEADRALEGLAYQA